MPRGVTGAAADLLKAAIRSLKAELEGLDGGGGLFEGAGAGAEAGGWSEVVDEVSWDGDGFGLGCCC